MKKIYAFILFLTFGFQPCLALPLELSDIIRDARETQMQTEKTNPVSKKTEKTKESEAVKEPACACDSVKERIKMPETPQIRTLPNENKIPEKKETDAFSSKYKVPETK